MAIDALQVRQRPLVAEIAGPAGAGKSTLLLALNQHDPTIRSVSNLRSVGYAPFLAGSAVALLPMMLRQYRARKRLAWREMRMMLRLQAMHYLLGRRLAQNSAMTILDQGPVYTLARLHEFGFADAKSRKGADWWGRILGQWAASLDLIIWLDAPDATLARRIDTRTKWHSVKGQPEHEIYHFLARFRMSYEQIIAQLTAHGGPRVLCFNTDQETLDQITNAVLAAFRSDYTSDK
jgi:hypothetical protein